MLLKNHLKQRTMKMCYYISLSKIKFNHLIIVFFDHNKLTKCFFFIIILLDLQMFFFRNYLIKIYNMTKHSTMHDII